jgi:hypothetical protein
VDDSLRFTISLDDMVATQRLATRRFALGGSAMFILIGLGLFAAGMAGGLVVAALGLLMLANWRFPIGDRWFIRRQLAARIGATSEIWLDEAGIAYRQTGFTGHIDWEAITRIIEDDRAIIFMQGGIALMAIPKRAFGSSEAATQFVSKVRRASDITGH